MNPAGDLGPQRLFPFLDGGPDDHITPRDLYRAMCIALAMGEDRMAERLRLALSEALSAAAATSGLSTPAPPRELH